MGRRPLNREPLSSELRRAGAIVNFPSSSVIRVEVAQPLDPGTRVWRQGRRFASVVRRVRCGRRRYRDGFSLLELIVATALMGIAIVGLLSLVTTSLANASHVREYDRAAMLARTKMSQLLIESPLPLGPTLSGRFDARAGWEAQAVPFELLGPPRRGAQMLVRVALTVWWEAEGRRKSIELEGYRKMTVLPEHEAMLSGLAR